MISIESNKPEDTLSVDKQDQRENEERGEPAEQLVSISLKEDDPTKTIQIGLQLLDPECKQLVDLLRANTDIFA